MELFAGRQDSLSVTEIHELIGAPYTTCVDIVHTLCAKGYLSNYQDRRKYSPTTKLYHLGQQITVSGYIREVEQQLEYLRDKTSETCMLSHWTAERLKIVAIRLPAQPLRYSVDLGENIGLHITAAGKSVIGLMTPEQRAALLPRLKFKKITDKSITSKAEFIRDLEQANQRGWYESVGEANDEIMALAVPFVIQNELYAMSIGGPIERIKNNYRKNTKYLLEAKESLNKPHVRYSR